MRMQDVSLPYYDEILDFLAAGPSAEHIVTFRPRPETQERFRSLLAANRQRTLTASEEEELDHYIRIEQIMSLLKAKAYQRLDQRVT